MDIFETVREIDTYDVLVFLSGCGMGTDRNKNENEQPVS